MQTSFVNVFKYHVSGQLVARIFSFIMNLYLIRLVDLSLLGFISVRMNLFYQTVGFLSREPLRKTCLDSTLSIKDSLHYALLSSVLFFVLSAICALIWWFLPLPDDVDLSNDINYGLVLLAFVGSTLLEGVVEPVAILSLKMGENAHFAFSHSLLAVLQKFIALVLILSGCTGALSAFCIAQFGASLCYCICHLRKFFTHYLAMVRKSFSGTWHENFISFRYEMKYLVLIVTILGHSVLKQFITSGSSYIMAFTNIFSLKTQAVYDAVERLASLVTRLFLTPLEESAAIYFASTVRHHTQPQYHIQKSSISSMQGSSASLLSHYSTNSIDCKNSNSICSDNTSCVPQKAIITFSSLLRLVLILGMVVCVFGIPYSRTVIRVYGGEILVKNEGGKYLALYTIYIFFMALNGIIECFAFASMDTTQIFSHGTFLFLSAILHLALSVAFSSFVGASGFIVANCVNTALRIYYNWQHICALFGGKTPCQLSIGALRPSLNLVILLVFSFLLTSFSMMIFDATGGFIHTGAHIAVGSVTFLLVLAYIYQSEDLFTNFLEKIH